MTRPDRRQWLATGAAMTTGAVMGCAAPAGANHAQRTPFSVPGVSIPIAGSDMVFPVRRIYCIGRNYAAHAREMGSDPTREPPFFFQKPTDAIQHVPPGTVADHPYPTLTKNYHYEADPPTVRRPPPTDRPPRHHEERLGHDRCRTTPRHAPLRAPRRGPGQRLDGPGRCGLRNVS